MAGGRGNGKRGRTTLTSSDLWAQAEGKRRKQEDEKRESFSLELNRLFPMSTGKENLFDPQAVKHAVLQLIKKHDGDLSAVLEYAVENLEFYHFCENELSSLWAQLIRDNKLQEKFGIDEVAANKLQKQDDVSLFRMIMGLYQFSAAKCFYNLLSADVYSTTPDSRAIENFQATVGLAMQYDSMHAAGLFVTYIEKYNRGLALNDACETGLLRLLSKHQGPLNGIVSLFYFIRAEQLIKSIEPYTQSSGSLLLNLGSINDALDATAVALQKSQKYREEYNKIDLEAKAKAAYKNVDALKNARSFSLYSFGDGELSERLAPLQTECAARHASLAAEIQERVLGQANRGHHINPAAAA